MKKETREFAANKKGTFTYGNYSLDVQPQGFVEEFWTK